MLGAPEKMASIYSPIYQDVVNSSLGKTQNQLDFLTNTHYQLGTPNSLTFNMPPVKTDVPTTFKIGDIKTDIKSVDVGSKGTVNPWKPGEPNDSPTRGGNYPSWGTAKKRHWKNRTNSSSEDEFSPGNLERMKKGKPPLHDEVEVPQELHHKKGRNVPKPHNSENLEELWPWEHDAVDPFRHYRGPRPKGE